jgi:hypothetical protein
MWHHIMKRNSAASILFAGILLFSSCINLKKVNDYASGSLKGLKKWEDLGYSYTKDCRDKCVLEQLAANQLRKPVCDCRTNQEADSILLVIYNACMGYFTGLVKLSGNKLTDYNPAALTKALNEGKFGDITINKTQTDAYAALVTGLLRVTTDAWRKKKIAGYIGDANAPVHTLLQSLDFILESSLAKKLSVKKEMIESYYLDLWRNPGISAYEKKKLIEEYNSAVSGIATQQAQIATLGKLLGSIANGHQRLYENRNRLTAAEARELLTAYGNSLEELINRFNKLKNNR